jgi:hypothetical protein
MKLSLTLLAVFVFCTTATGPEVHPLPAPVPWDHPGHMTTAAIAFAEIERARPDLIEQIGLLFLKHPDPAPYWVAAGDAKGKERVRRMFIEAARWADDSKWTLNDRLAWHSARWAIIADDAPPEAIEAANAHEGRPAGQAIEALTLMAAMLSNPETPPLERAWALGWMMHIVGDIHQPMHVSDLYSEEFPTGNAAATLSYVDDPMGETTIPLHLLWDSNVMRSPNLAEVDKYAQAFLEKYPRSSFPELNEHPLGDPEVFREWARESHQVAIDWAYDIQSVRDPNTDQDADKLVANMIKFILEGISPVDEAPEVPAEYWEQLQRTAERRLTLAGYRIADIVIAAADNISTHREYLGR